MKLEEWGHIIVTWASFLDPKEDITTIEDLLVSDLFTRLLRELLSSHKNISDKNDFYHYLQAQYPNLDLGELCSENKEDLILKATAFLIYCSLHHEENDLQKKMTELPGWTQLCLSDFLKEFVDISNASLTRELIFSQISVMQSVIPEKARQSPKFGTPITFSSSPSDEGSKTYSSSKKTSKLKRLRKEIEDLNNMKTELTEELENAKESLSELESTIKKRDIEINRLKHELAKAENKEHVCEAPQLSTSEIIKMDRLKHTIDCLEQDKERLETDLRLTRDEKESLHAELQKLKRISQEADFQIKVYAEDRSELEKQINNLKITISQLTATTQEQADYIQELTRAKDDSKTFSDSHNDSLILPESLGQHVVDLELREAKDLLEIKINLIQDLELELEGKNETLKDLSYKLKELEKKHSEACSEFIVKEKILLEEIKSKITIINNNEQELRKSEYQNASLSTALEEKVSIINKMVEDHKCEIGRKIEMVENLKVKLKESEDAYALVCTEFLEKERTLLMDIESKNILINNKEDDLKNLESKLSTFYNTLHEKEIVINKMVEDHKSEIKGKIEMVENLKMKIKELEDAYALVCTDFSEKEKTLLLDIESKNILIKNNEDDLKNLECKLSTLYNTLQEKEIIMNKMVEDHKCEIEAKIEMVENLKVKLKESEDAYTLVSTQFSEKEKTLLMDIESKNILINDKEDDLKNLESQLSTLYNTLQEKEIIMNKIIEDHKCEIEGKIEMVENLKVKLKESEDAYALVCTEFSEKEKTLLMDIESKNILINNKEDDLKNMECKLSTLYNTLQEKEITINKLVEDHKCEIEKMTETIENLKAKLNKSEGAYTLACTEFSEKEKALLMDIESKNILINNNKDDLKNLESKLSTLYNTLEEKEILINKMVEDHKCEIEARIEMLENLKVKLKESEDAYALVCSEFSEKEKKLLMDIESKNIMIYNKEDDLKNLESKLSTLYNTLQEKEIIIDDLKKYESEIQVQNEIMESLKLKLKETEEKYVNVCEEFNVKEKSYLDAIESKLLTIKNNEEDMRNLECQNLFLTNTLQEKDSVVVSMQSSLDVLNDELTSLRNKRNLLTGETQLKDSYIQQLVKEVDALTIIVNDYTVEKDTLQKVIESKERALEECFIKLDQVETEFNNRIQMMGSELEHKQQECKLYEENRLQLMRDLDFYKEQLDSLEKKLERKENEIFENINHIGKLEMDIEEYKSAEQQFLLNANSYELNARKLENDLAIQRTELTNEIENHKSSISSLESENDALKKEVKSVISKLRDLEAEHSGCDEKNLFAESVINELRDKEQILKSELSKTSEREDCLKIEISKKESSILSLKEEIKCLKKALSDSEFESGILLTKLQAKEAEVNKLKLEIGDITGQMKLNEERLQEELKIHIQKINDLDTIIGKLNNQFLKVSRERETLISELDQKKEDITTLQSDYDTLEREKKKLEKELIKKSDDLSNLESICHSSEAELELLKNKNTTLLADLEASKNELVQANEQHFIQITSKDKLISLSEQKVVELQKINDKIKSEISVLKDTIRSRDENVEKILKEKNVLMLDLELENKKRDILNKELEEKIKEIEDSQSKYATAEAESSRLRIKCSEQEETLRSLYGTLHSQNSILNEKDNEILLLQGEIKSVNEQLIEERKKYEQLKLREKDEDVIVKTEVGTQDKSVDAQIQEIKTSYEKKLESYKSILKKRFAEKLEDLTYTLQNENTELKEKCLKEQERCAKLQSELWNASDKLLIYQEQNRTLLTKIQCRNNFEVVRPNEPLSPMSKARSMEVLSGRNRGIDNFARDISLNESGSSRRSSIRSLPRGMGKKLSFSTGKVFPAAEEDGEVFDSRYLADLKAGVCNVPYDQDRMSTLQYRNSLCPPHLKSSYPAETQFINEFREDDIKCGSRLGNANSDTDLRRTKLQSSYKKPGPPTPSKNGGRHSLQGNERITPMTPKSSGSGALSVGKEGIVNESFVLRESNGRTSKAELPPPRPKVTTPSRLRALFTNRRDENSPRRKSLLTRKK